MISCLALCLYNVSTFAVAIFICMVSCGLALCSPGALLLSVFVVVRSMSCVECGISGDVCPVINEGSPVGWVAYLAHRWGKRYMVCRRLGNVVCGLWIRCGC